MKRYILIAVAALALSGCANLQAVFGIVTGTSVTPAQAYIAANAFDAIETAANSYLGLPACGSAGASSLCRKASVVNVLVPAIRVGYTARKNLINAVASGNDAPISLYTALTSQTTTLQALETTYGIGATK
jgi:hypothetical protein